MRSVILSVQGRYAEAKEACGPVERLSTELVASVCTAHIDGLTGRAHAAESALSRRVFEAVRATASEKLWAMTELAEIATRLGEDAAAESYFQQALAIDRQDAYLLAAFADFLLDHGRAAEVVPLLADKTSADGLLLRLAIAEQAMKAPEREAHKKVIEDRFLASRLRGEVVHRREEARFMLALEGAAQEALRLARANWEVQREPADLRVYLEAAIAAHDRAAPALEFLTNSKLEDVRIAALARQLR
jgi:Tfp pilus assembly protein PilF